ncbi:TPA: preprotein translocase subunit SecE [Candidatus Bipolaricaulota bacterium]|nr:preprotein translocase subunit SecE [Candidatus Bipolaricaulota bacterium]
MGVRVLPGLPMLMFERIKQYLRGVRAEFGKISWPSQAEVFSLTILVLAMVLVLTIYTGILDALFSWLLQHLIRS